MTEKQDQPEPAELSTEELEAQSAEELPDREAMSLIQPHPTTLPPIGAMPPPPIQPLEPEA